MDICNIAKGDILYDEDNNKHRVILVTDRADDCHQAEKANKWFCQLGNNEWNCGFESDYIFVDTVNFETEYIETHYITKWSDETLDQ